MNFREDAFLHIREKSFVKDSEEFSRRADFT